MRIHSDLTIVQDQKNAFEFILINYLQDIHSNISQDNEH